MARKKKFKYMPMNSIYIYASIKIYERRQDGDIQKINGRKFISLLDLQKLPFFTSISQNQSHLVCLKSHQISQTWHESFNNIRKLYRLWVR